MGKKSYKELEEELKAYAAPAPHEAVARRARRRVADTGTSADGATAPEADKPKGMEYFKSLILGNSKLYNAYTSLGLVGGLLRDSYKNPRPGESVTEIMGFDTDNLHGVMQAVFGKLEGTYVRKSDIVSYLSKPQWSQLQILYYDVLKLKDDSTSDEIDAKAEELKQVIDRFEGLLSYGGVENVSGAIRASKENEDPNVSTEDIVKQYGLPVGEAEDFDADVIEETLDGLKSGSSARPTSGPEASYAQFYFENKALMAPLEKFQDAFASLSPDEWAEMAPKLDAKFPGAPMGISLNLSLALAPGKNASDLIKAVSVAFGTKDPDVLKEKMEVLSQAVQELKPELFEAPAPASPEAASEAEERPTMDYYQFYQDEIESDPEMVEAYMPLFNLYYAIKRSEEKFKKKDETEKLFNGLSKPEVMIELNGLLGEGMAQAMEASAKAGKGEKNVRTALIKAIAEKGGFTSPEELKKELVRVKEILTRRFPRLLENLA